MAKRRGESNGPGLLKVLAVAFGAGVVGAVVFDLHSHACESCGRKWKHLGEFNHGDVAAHTCPRCGKVQWNQDGYQDQLLPPDGPDRNPNAPIGTLSPDQLQLAKSRAPK